MIPLSFLKEPIDIILAKCTLQKKVLRQDQATLQRCPPMSEPLPQKPKRTKHSSPNIINTPNWLNSFLAIISEKFYCDDTSIRSDVDDDVNVAWIVKTELSMQKPAAFAQSKVKAFIRSFWFLIVFLYICYNSSWLKSKHSISKVPCTQRVPSK